MTTISGAQRLSAAGVAISITFSIVWAMSGYAYPEPSSFLPTEMAKEKVPALKACS